MKPQHYVHAFTCGAICSFTMDPAKPGAMVDCRWSRKLLPHERGATLREYLRWKGSVMQTEADRQGRSIVEWIEVRPGRWLRRAYSPTRAK